MSLDEKMSKCRAEVMHADEAERPDIVAKVRSEMSRSEMQSGWGKLYTSDARDPELMLAYDKAGENDKGRLIVA
jgi:hypothetical protein